MQKEDWFEPDCPLCQQLKEDIENGLAEPFDWYEEEIDYVASEVLDLIEAGQLEAAEAAARELIKEFPLSPDGLDSLAAVFEAKGEYLRAIQHLESALAFTRVHEGFRDDDREYFRRKIRDLQAKIP